MLKEGKTLSTAQIVRLISEWCRSIVPAHRFSIDPTQSHKSPLSGMTVHVMSSQHQPGNAVQCNVVQPKQVPQSLRPSLAVKHLTCAGKSVERQFKDRLG